MIGEQKKKRLQSLIKSVFRNGTSERELSDWYIENGLENKLSLYEFSRGELLKVAREVIKVRENTRAEMIEWANKPSKKPRTKFKGYEYIDKDFLEAHYTGQGLTVEEIADLCECSIEFIYKRLHTYGIELMPHKKIKTHKRKTVDKEVLQEYINSGFTVKEMADMCCCATSTLRLMIKGYKIQLPNYKRKRSIVIPKETLEELISNGYSIKKMEKELGYSYTTIRLALNEYDLSI